MSSEGDKFRMRAALHNLPSCMTHISSALTIVERRWAMTTVVRFFISRSNASLHQAFAFRVESRRGLVEYEDSRILEIWHGRCLCVGAGLPERRQPRSPIYSLIAFRVAMMNTRHGVGYSRRPHSTSSIAGGSTECYVVEESVVEKYGSPWFALPDQAAQVAHTVITYVVAVHSTLPLSTSQKRGIRSTSVDLPLPDCPTSATVAPFDLQIYIFENLTFLVVAEVDVAEADVAPSFRPSWIAGLGLSGSRMHSGHP